MTKKVYLDTYGCQMNARDSEEVLGMLEARGYGVAVTPEEADVILLNTCAVREHASERAISNMGRFRELKEQRPEMVLGLLGCVAKLHGETIFKRLPFVDVVCGPAELYDLPDALAAIHEKRQRTLLIDRPFRPLDQRPAGDHRSQQVSAFVTIIEGCDKRCTYCIVPTTRGQEVSRPANEIIDEVQQLADRGYREVTLLGQNVNSYGKRLLDGSGYRGPQGRRQRRPGEDWVDFPALLRRIDGDTSIDRLRFTTSHPFDAREDLFDAMADCHAVCESLHLPVQSGSDRVLRAMQRGYTIDSYCALLQQLRARVPDVTVSTDIIVGFPGETEDDFAATVQLMEAVAFDMAYIFKYSPRPGTLACELSDDVTESVKAARHQHLLAVHQGIARRQQQAWIGRTVEVLIESRKNAQHLLGRTRTNRMVVCPGADTLIGELVQVQIEELTNNTFVGRHAS